MATSWNIFLSYENSDRARALKLVGAFQEEGWSVWWDHKIPPGNSWADVIERAIKASDCVVVLWSRTSITSEWVKKEARAAANRKCLIPVRIDEVELPWEFEHLQAADLVDWKGYGTDGFADLIETLRSISGMEPAEPIDAPEQSDNANENENSKRPARKTLLFPVHGVTLGKTTRSEIAWLGSRTKDISDHAYVVRGIKFKYDEKSNLVDGMYVDRSTDLPESWLTLGFGWQKSYIEWLAVLQGLGYETAVTKKPHLERFVGEDTFSAVVVGHPPAGYLDEIELRFGYEPGTSTSCGTLYSINISIAAEEGDQEIGDDSEDVDDSEFLEEDDA